MDLSNYENILNLTRNQDEAKKVKLLLSELSIGIDEVPDPYYGGEDGFDQVYEMIDKACDAIAKKIKYSI